MDNELQKISSASSTDQSSLLQLCELFRSSLINIQKIMTDGYLSLRSIDDIHCKFDFTPNGVQNSAVTLTVIIIKVKQLSQLESISPANFILELMQIMRKFFEELQTLFANYDYNTIFNELDTIYKKYLQIIKNAIVKLSSHCLRKC